MIALGDNIGFARANNLAAQYASGEYILLLGPDTVVLDDAIYRLLAFAKTTPDAGVWGGETLFGDRSLNPYSCWGNTTLWSLFCGLTGLRALFPHSALFHTEAYGSWKRDTVKKVDIITGCFLLIRHTLWDKLGGFDPIFFMYGEDMDLCMRAKALGYQPIVTPDAAIVHYAGASEWLPARKHIQLFASGVAIMNRHWPWPKRIFGRLLYSLYPYPRLLGYWALAALTGRDGARKQAEVWKTVVKEKRKWISGYASATTSLADTSPEPQRLHPS